MDPFAPGAVAGTWILTDSAGSRWTFSDGLWREIAVDGLGARFPPSTFLARAANDPVLAPHLARVHFVMMEREPLEGEPLEDEPTNACVICGLDLGRENPRQLCRKTYCPEMGN